MHYPVYKRGVSSVYVQQNLPCCKGVSLQMRRFLLNRTARTPEQTGEGVVAVGCEMWEGGPVALILTVPPNHPVWYVNIHALQAPATRDFWEIVFIDDERDSFIDQIRHRYHVSPGSPADELQETWSRFRGMVNQWMDHLDVQEQNHRLIGLLEDRQP